MKTPLIEFDLYRVSRKFETALLHRFGTAVASRTLSKRLRSTFSRSRADIRGDCCTGLALAARSRISNSSHQALVSKLFLRPLEEQELISVWDDTEIRPGADWLSEIRKALESARVAVFLVSQDFLASPFIRERELPTLIEAATNRGCQIFWIAVSSSTVEDSPLAKFQGAISPGSPLDLLSEAEQNKVLTEIYRKMKAVVTVQ